MTSLQLLILLFLYQASQTNAARTISLPVGGLFNRYTQQSSREAFENIVKMGDSNVYYGRTMYSNAEDSYSTALDLCEITSDNKGVVALIDARPTYGLCDTVCLLCNRYNIPHLSLGWEPPDTLAEELFTFSYYPPPDLISKAYARLIKDLEWDKFSILYEDETSFIRLHEIINTWPQDRKPIVFRKLDPNGDNKETFKYILKAVHISYHVLDCDINNVYKYMREIMQVENSTEYLSFVLTDLNSFTINFKDIPNLLANISTMHLTTSGDDKWTDIGINKDKEPIRLETALVVDALNHVEKAIRAMQQEGDEEGQSISIGPHLPPEPPSMCYKDSKADYENLAWTSGNILREALLNTTAIGLTGNLQFDEEGRRMNFTLHYSKLSNDGEFVNIGHWDSTTDLIKKENYVEDRPKSMVYNTKIRVATRDEKPYYGLYEYPNKTSEYRGYAVDLIDEIFTEIKKKENVELEYEFYIVDGNKHGNLIAGTNKWDGLIGDLIEHKAELAICDLTITSERNAVVDFSIPFMSLGISMLFKEADPVDPDMFSFIKPLSLDVWLYLATTYIIVSFVLLICARMSQDDWVNPHPCNQNPENLQNIWSLYNCMWLTMGAIMTQGCDILPRGKGSRWTAGVWWFFALIITASYTANMSTFISNERRSNEITNVKQLSEQTKVSYGAVYNASTYNFFKNSNDSVYQKIWTVMKSAKPKVFTNNNEEGKERVLRSKNGNFAFFMESSAIEYFRQRDCRLKMVGNKLDSKEYGIAMPKNYPRKAWIDNAILSLQEMGKLTALQKKWWEEEGDSKHCDKNAKNEDDGGSLQMKNTSGIFLVLGVGGILGLIVAVIEFLFHARQISVKEKVTFHEAVASEWRASLNPRQLHKPAAPPRSAPPSTGSPSPRRERSQSRAVSVLRAASSFINFDEIY
ncbi:glutamate receptor ionotropic, kainate 2-like isoform X1 [Galleria mellonella]|uniref:Glutamate receptor ionotropic, kainate 2-like isoform X1 n=1 Tax=Galleria mellonella TaxID=7137 RepID=A0A6J1W814_GALME|nr:glutamate receptor ionotropic, kainate 2-like isoform X1 [Galleria mellonella]